MATNKQRFCIYNLGINLNASLKMRTQKARKGSRLHKGESLFLRCTTEQKERLQAVTEILKEVLGQGLSQSDVLFFVFDRYNQTVIDQMPKRE